jgi:hypothetical protein
MPRHQTRQHRRIQPRPTVQCVEQRKSRLNIQHQRNLPERPRQLQQRRALLRQLRDLRRHIQRHRSRPRPTLRTRNNNRLFSHQN